MEKNAKIYIAWHNGFVWSAIKRKLEELWYTNLVFKSSKELNLTDINKVKNFFEKEKPNYVFLAAAKVWGILANNNHPAEFIYENLQIQNNVIHNAYLYGVKKLLFLWSTCIYPKFAKQPIKEEELLNGKLEPTNEPYAIAKIAWIKMCQSYNRQYGTNFIACMPTNLYGPYDNFDLKSSHVLPAMIRKFHEAKLNSKKEVVLWWDGSPYREFLYVEDMAEACIYLMKYFNPTKEQNEKWEIFLNVWSWLEISIKELAEIIQKEVGFNWKIIWDKNKPNGTPRKLTDLSKIHKLWWKHKIDLKEWIKKTYKWFLENKLN